MDDYQLIQKSADGKWQLLQKEGYYYFAGENGKVVKTPRGYDLVTSYKELADRILKDLADTGTDNFSASSVLPWHYTMVDNFCKMPHQKVESILIESFLTKRDWTFSVSTRSKFWKEVFSTAKVRLPQIRSWLSKATHMQLTAACCIGNAFHSLNLAFVLALLMEHYEGEKRQEKFKKLIEFIDEYDDDSEYYADPETLAVFELYYGIHKQEEGNIINLDLQAADDVEEENINCIGLSVSEAELIGRNYYHYHNGILDDDHDRSALLDGLVLDLDDDDEDSEEDWDEEDEEEDVQDNRLSEYVDDDCWIKRINAMIEDLQAYYLIALTVEDGKITDCTVLREVHEPMMFYIPGAGGEISCYEELPEAYYPESVVNEICRLSSHAYLGGPLIDRRLPQKMIDAGRNGNSDTDYTYAVQSAYRSAYMHMSVTTTPQGIITAFDYSTYHSSGNSWADMFSRPQQGSDRADEAIDMLLQIYDQYTEDERKQYF